MPSSILIIDADRNKFTIDYVNELINSYPDSFFVLICRNPAEMTKYLDAVRGEHVQFGFLWCFFRGILCEGSDADINGYYYPGGYDADNRMKKPSNMIAAMRALKDTGLQKDLYESCSYESFDYVLHFVSDFPTVRVGNGTIAAFMASDVALNICNNRRKLIKIAHHETHFLTVAIDLVNTTSLFREVNSVVQPNNCYVNYRLICLARGLREDDSRQKILREYITASLFEVEKERHLDIQELEVIGFYAQKTRSVQKPAPTQYNNSMFFCKKYTKEKNEIVHVSEVETTFFYFLDYMIIFLICLLLRVVSVDDYKNIMQLFSLEQIMKNEEKVCYADIKDAIYDFSVCVVMIGLCFSLCCKSVIKLLYPLKNVNEQDEGFACKKT